MQNASSVSFCKNVINNHLVSFVISNQHCRNNILPIYFVSKLRLDWPTTHQTNCRNLYFHVYVLIKGKISTAVVYRSLLVESDTSACVYYNYILNLVEFVCPSCYLDNWSTIIKKNDESFPSSSFFLWQLFEYEIALPS